MTEKTKEINGSVENNEELQAGPQTEVEAEAQESTEHAHEGLPSAEELMQSLQVAEAKAEENWANMLRLQAELENSRRRAERDVQAAHKFALEKFVNELLPVKDSLELGELAALAENADVEKVREGIELTLKMMTDVMGKFGVAEVNPVGEPFNPDLHQAMSMQDAPDAKPNTVVNVFQKGYQLNERLVRPAMVVVASANSGSSLGQSPGENSIDEMA